MPNNTRIRASSINNVNDRQRARMDKSLDDLQVILKEVEYDWRHATQSDANPLDVALPLLDNTSVGLAHRRGEFIALNEKISDGLRSAVNEHYQAFNDSIGSYRSVVLNLTNCQSLVSDIEKTVNGSLDDFKGNDDSLSTLNENLKTYNDMIVILSSIEDLKRASIELSDSVEDKNYGKAQNILQSVYEKAGKLNLWQLSALSNLKEYFHTQSEQLFETLVEELHTIIYSKRQFSAFNSATEFLKNTETSDYSNIEKFLSYSIDTDISENVSLSHSKVEEFLNVFSKLAESEINTDLDDDNDDYNTTNVLDDTNPFNQILQVLTIINKQGKLQITTDIIIQRMSLELNQLINRIVEDVKSRHSKLIKGLNTSRSNTNFLHSLTDDGYSAIVVQDLFWNFFKKLLFFEQSIKVILVIIKRFQSSSTDTFNYNFLDSKNSTYSLKEGAIDLEKLWDLLKVEVKTLVLAYISETDTVLTQKLTTNTLDLNQKNSLFQFYHVNYNKDHTKQLKHVLQDLFPGFINSNDMSKIDSPYIEDTKFFKQSTIIPPNILNMRHILEPFLLFTQGSSLLFEKNEGEPLIFFKNFMASEFLPILEESFVSLYIDEVEDGNPLEVYDPVYNITPNEAISTRADIFKLFVEFKIFLSDICFILNTSLQFRREFTSIIFKILERFHEKAQELQQDLFNELFNYLEPNRELITYLKGTNKGKLSSLPLGKINKSELKNSQVFHNINTLQSSFQFLLKLLDNNLIKNVDLNKTDINLTEIEKLRKNWSFFEIVNMRSNALFGEHDGLNVEKSNKIILNEDLKVEFNDIVSSFKKLLFSTSSILNSLNEILQIV